MTDAVASERTSAPRAADLSLRPLYEPIADLLAGLPDRELPDAPALDAMLGDRGVRPCTAGGRSISFVVPPRDRIGYEERIHATGKIATRPDCWHDVFNALVWMRFPAIKAVLNARHAGAAPATRGTRGALRDATTQFDESGAIVASPDASLLELLRSHRWRDLFVDRRAAVRARMRLFVVGHGLYDALREPFRGLCAKAVLLPVDPSFLAAAPPRQWAAIDRLAAARLRDPAACAAPGDLQPLPVLGWPGVTPRSEEPAYYDDAGHFRPARREGR